MRNVKWLIAAGLVVAVTGCVETNGYPTTSVVSSTGPLDNGPSRRRLKCVMPNG